MDAARRLQTAVKETVEIAVNHLFPQVKQLVAEEILRQFEPPLTGLRGPTGTKGKGKGTRSSVAPKVSRKIAAKKAVKTKAARASKMKGRKLTKKQMQCRHPGCTKRSMGPKYSFRCETHPINGRPNLTVLKGGAGNGKSSKVASVQPKGAKKAA